MNSERSVSRDSMENVSWVEESQETETGSVVLGEPASGPRSVTSSSCPSFCHLCGYESGRQSNLKRHLKTMHESASTKSFNCCDINFNDKAEYRDHCRQVHGQGHECPTCQRRFSRRALLRRHESVHTGFKEFKCHVCTYGSSHKSNLERHLRTHSTMAITPLNPARRNRKVKSHKHVQPDSTTSGSRLAKSQFPILRTMLRDSSSPIQKKRKPNLSHSIESILNRKEMAKDKLVMIPSQPLINYKVPEEGKTGVCQELIPNSTHVLPPPSTITGFSPNINHSLSSPFSLTPFPEQDLRNQVPSWRLPPWICQDLRIFSSAINYFEPPQQIWWNPFIVPSRPHLLPGSNYLYPHYDNNGESAWPLL